MYVYILNFDLCTVTMCIYTHSAPVAGEGCNQRQDCHCPHCSYQSSVVQLQLCIGYWLTHTSIIIILLFSHFSGAYNIHRLMVVQTHINIYIYVCIYIQRERDSHSIVMYSYCIVYIQFTYSYINPYIVEPISTEASFFRRFATGTLRLKVLKASST